MELLTLPVIVRMIVALAALNLDAEEDAGHLGSAFLSPCILRGQDRGRAVSANVARRGDEVGRNLVPGFVLVELCCKVRNECVRHELRAILEATRHDEIAPVAGPVLAILLLVE